MQLILLWPVVLEICFYSYKKHIFATLKDIIVQNKVRKIELLAPARNLSTAMAAINCGADAVYMGAENYGARQLAGNSMDDIATVVNYAHLFGVKVYVALNTIIDDSDIPAVEQLITGLYNIGVDALIVQDMGVLRMSIPPIPLHASTQTDNRTVDKVRFLAESGIPRVVLARELSLQQISEIHTALPDTELEVFVHGALCVSFSGQCYASQHCFGRSANKGACAQFCRLAFDLIDSDGNVVCRDKHLLSLKDMNRSDFLEELLDAGVTSLKIEGRLKDESYVKNVTAYYRAKLDAIFERRNEYKRASYGRCNQQFIPALEKSFNRGFTDYMLFGNKKGMTSMNTPKSIGEPMGVVRIVARNFFTIGGRDFNNGDGACFFGQDGKLYGFRINKVDGNRIFPQTMPPLYKGAELFRNYDCDFERQLSRPVTPRRLALNLSFGETQEGFELSATDEFGIKASVTNVYNKEISRKPQYENIVAQLKKWGGTPFEVAKVCVNLSQEWFVPSSLLSEMRRDLCNMLLREHSEKYVREKLLLPSTSHKYIVESLDYRGNVSNRLARKFYSMHGVQSIRDAYESAPVKDMPVMFCKHCIKYALGYCTKSGDKHVFKEPFYLVSGDGRRFRLSFDCVNCEMTVIPC